LKGIILAGGTGSRLHPITSVVNKQLLPVYDKPMIYYPLSTLMLAGISEILLITTEAALPAFKALLGDGAKIGIDLSYVIQDQPNGLAESFILGREFIGTDRCALILGDNLFYGHGLTDQLQSAAGREAGATIFAYQVQDPQHYGVLALDGSGRVTDIVEKPADPPSQWAVTGLYFFDRDVVEIAGRVRPSARGELEITDVIKTYLERDAVSVEWLGRGYAWLDAGTNATLLQAAQYIGTLEQRQGLKIACIEEIAYRMNFIDIERFRDLADNYGESSYGQYLRNLAATL
jgi:glucose-1-phosphate thymidylyltransferase